MKIGLPLPYFESEGLEDSYRQYHESGTDETDADCFFMTIMHSTLSWLSMPFSYVPVLTAAKVQKKVKSEE
jgi:hypothetical protein